mgnify:CR=1 FL=1
MFYRKGERNEEEKIYADRTPRRDRHHCNPGQYALAGSRKSPGKGQKYFMHKQHETTGNNPGNVQSRLQRLDSTHFC